MLKYIVELIYGDSQSLPYSLKQFILNVSKFFINLTHSHSEKIVTRLKIRQCEGLALPGAAYCSPMLVPVPLKGSSSLFAGSRPCVEAEVVQRTYIPKVTRSSA